ncbi:hypothetical protein [Streptomyces sp. SID5785]|nr:hypothetical protein [Streptomyces sp. SID5785]
MADGDQGAGATGPEPPGRDAAPLDRGPTASPARLVLVRLP